MAIPLSAIRKYSPEIIAVSIIAVVLGAFWSIIDTYQPSHLLDLNEEDAPLVIKFALTGRKLKIYLFIVLLIIQIRTLHFQLLLFLPFSSYGMLRKSSIIVVMQIF